MAEKREIAPLTGLRFIAALCVVVAHARSLIAVEGQYTDLKNWVGTASGFGMTLFFVLSGFVIHYNYRETVTRGSVDGIAGFAWARFSRLYPLYLLIIATDLMIGPTARAFRAGVHGVYDEVMFALPYYLTSTQSWLYLTGDKSSLIYMLGSSTPLTWSISTEWFFYLVFPLFALVLVRLRSILSVLGIAAAVCVVWIEAAAYLFDQSPALDAWAVGHFGASAGLQHGNQDSFVRWLLYFSPYLRLGEFLLGCLAAQLYLVTCEREVTKTEASLGRAALVLGLFSVGIVTFLMYAENGWTFVRKLNTNFGLAPSAAVIVFCLARYRSWFAWLMSTRPLLALGEASYSIYLLHVLVIISVYRIGLGPERGRALETWIGVLPLAVVRYAVTVAIVCVVAMLSYRIVEVPARSWLRTLRARHTGKKSWKFVPASAPMVLALAVLALHPGPAPLLTNVTEGIRVISASYGLNCGVSAGNATHPVQRACNGRTECRYVVYVGALGDPAQGCAKSFRVDYACAPATHLLRADIPGEAGLGSRIRLTCKPETTHSSQYPR